MAKDIKVYGSNVFIFGKVGTAFVMVGCATGFKRSVKNTAQDVSCPGNGNAKSYVPGRLPDFDLSLDAIAYRYTGTDTSINIGIQDFWNDCALGVQREIYLAQEKNLSITPAPPQPAPPNPSEVEKTTFIVESCDETGKFGENSTYSVSGKASGGWITEVL